MEVQHRDVVRLRKTKRGVAVYHSGTGELVHRDGRWELLFAEDSGAAYISKLEEPTHDATDCEACGPASAFASASVSEHPLVVWANDIFAYSLHVAEDGSQYLFNRMTSQATWLADRRTSHASFALRFDKCIQGEAQVFVGIAAHFNVPLAPFAHIYWELQFVQFMVKGSSKQRWCHDRWRGWASALVVLGCDPAHLLRGHLSLQRFRAREQAAATNEELTKTTREYSCSTLGILVILCMACNSHFRKDEAHVASADKLSLTLLQ